MTFAIDPALRELIEKKGRRNIVVDVVTADHSDFDVTELHVFLVSDRHAGNLIKEKNFHPKQAGDDITVLLPNYRLEYDETITFGVKKVLWFTVLTHGGIHL